MSSKTTYWNRNASDEALLIQLSDARRPLHEELVEIPDALLRLREMGLADVCPGGWCLTVDGHHAQQDARLARLERMMSALSEDVGGLMLGALAGEDGEISRRVAALEEAAASASDATADLRGRSEGIEARLEDAEAFTGDAEGRLAVIEHRLGVGRPGLLERLRARAAGVLRALAGRVEARP